MKKMFNKKKQAGLTIIELMIAIGIAVFVTAIAIKPAAKLFSDANSTAELNDLPVIVFNMQKAAKNDPNYTGWTIDQFARYNVFPEDRRTIPATGSATATNRWGGNLTGAPVNLTGTNDVFRIVSPNIPNAECIDVVTGAASVMRRVVVDNTNSATANTGTEVKADGAKMSSSALAGACGSLNTITFDIGK